MNTIIQAPTLWGVLGHGLAIVPSDQLGFCIFKKSGAVTDYLNKHGYPQDAHNAQYVKDEENGGKSFDYIFVRPGRHDYILTNVERHMSKQSVLVEDKVVILGDRNASHDGSFAIAFDAKFEV